MVKSLQDPALKSHPRSLVYSSLDEIASFRCLSFCRSFNLWIWRIEASSHVVTISASFPLFDTTKHQFSDSCQWFKRMITCTTTNSLWSGLEWDECSLLRRGFGSLKKTGSWRRDHLKGRVWEEIQLTASLFLRLVCREPAGLPGTGQYRVVKAKMDFLVLCSSRPSGPCASG